MVANSEFGRISYTDAIEILKEHNDEFEYKVYWGCDLQTEYERYLTEKVFKKPVFVTDYPKEKGFHMRPMMMTRPLQYWTVWYPNR